MTIRKRNKAGPRLSSRRLTKLACRYASYQHTQKTPAEIGRCLPHVLGEFLIRPKGGSDGEEVGKKEGKERERKRERGKREECRGDARQLSSLFPTLFPCLLSPGIVPGSTQFIIRWTLISVSAANPILGALISHPATTSNRLLITEWKPGTILLLLSLAPCHQA